MVLSDERSRAPRACRGRSAASCVRTAFHGSAGQGGVERVGDDVEIGQLGHGRRLYPRKPAC